VTYYLGTKGNVKLRRGSKVIYGGIEDQIIPDDVNTALNRLSFDKALDNILIGDRLDLSTADARGLACFPPETWGLASNATSEKTITAYVHVNEMGGLRFFRTFQDAVNNVRANEIPLAAFNGAPLEISARIRDVSYNVLGCVERYEYNTDRATIEASSLEDRFRQQLSAGLISGAGRIECEFNYRTTGFTEPALLLLQLIQRVEIGSEFDLALYLTDKAIDPTVDTIFYDLTAVVNRAGVQVAANDIVRCGIDFVTTGDIRLIYGKPAEYILKEDDNRIELEQSLDYLLQEIDD
jgi:hypothetical protein